MYRYSLAVLAAGMALAAVLAADADDPVDLMPRNLDQLNSAKDEDDPHEISSRTGLFYTVTSNGKTDLMVSQRAKPNLPWKAGTLWPQFDDRANYRSVFMSRDNSFPQQLYFATDKDPEKNAPGDNYDIYFLTRQGPQADYTFRTAEINIDTAADELHPWLTIDGKTMYFSRKDREGWHVYAATRPAPMGKFQKVVRVPLPDNFHHATLMPNGLSMYLQGPLEKGRWGLFKSTKTAAGWSQPQPQTALNHAEGPRGDMSPNLSRDGQYLYFASDRPGGKGGLDIWWIATAALAQKTP